MHFETYRQITRKKFNVKSLVFTLESLVMDLCVSGYPLGVTALRGSERKKDEIAYKNHTASRGVTVTAIWSLILWEANGAIIFGWSGHLHRTRAHRTPAVNTASAPHALRFKTRHAPLVRRGASPSAVKSRVIRARAL